MSSQSTFGTSTRYDADERAVAPDREEGGRVARVVVDPEDPRDAGGSRRSPRPRGSPGGRAGRAAATPREDRSRRCGHDQQRGKHEPRSSITTRHRAKIRDVLKARSIRRWCRWTQIKTIVRRDKGWAVVTDSSVVSGNHWRDLPPCKGGIRGGVPPIRAGRNEPGTPPIRLPCGKNLCPSASSADRSPSSSSS